MNSHIYSFSLTDKFLIKEEQEVFKDYLAYHGLEENIWPVFSCLFKSNTKHTKHLNALHGAFDRNRSSDYHAYDMLFVKMAEFAREHKLNSVDFGAVLNVTKKRIVIKTLEMSYFLMSK